MTHALRRLTRAAVNDAGLILPLACTTSLILVLASLSLQSVILQQRLIQGQRLERQRQNDRLASAAHRMTSLLSGQRRCLAPFPSTQWPSIQAQQLCPDPAGSMPPEQAIRVIDGVELISWIPDVDQSGGQLQLKLVGAARQRQDRLILTPAPTLQEQG